MLVNVEQGAANPSVGTLLRISDALGVGLPALVDPAGPSRCKVTRHGEGAVLWTRRGRRARRPGGRHGAAGCGRAVGLDPRLRGTSTSARPTRTGTKELLQVQEGTITLEVGDQSVDPRRRRCGRVPRRRAARYANPRRRSRRGSPWRCSSRASASATSELGRSSMADVGALEEFLAGARVDDAVFALRPDYRALLLAVDGLVPGRERRRQRGHCSRRPRPRPARRCGDRPVEQLPHVAAWREAYRAFGAKPQRTRNSLEALLRRARVRSAPREPAHRPLQRGLGAAPAPARRRGPHPLRRLAAAGPRHRRRSPSTPSPTATRCSSTPTAARWCGATTPA